MKRKIHFVYSTFILLAFAGLFLNDSNGRKGNYAGAPGDITCTDCHSDRTHDINGKVTLSGAPASFTSGVSYPLTLTLKDATAAAGGFQIVATNSSVGNNVMYGSFTAGTGTKIASTTGSGANRLTHNAPKAMSGGQVSWTFNWVAPATGSTARFYFAANATNWDNNESFGDAIYTSNQSGPIPIELMSFEGKMNGKAVKLTWKTASERNNSAFEIERSMSTNVDKFEKIGEIKGVGTSAAVNTYSFTDDAYQGNAAVYYRLRQVDFDGTSTLSKVVSIGTNALNKTLNVYPNFVTRGQDLTLETLNSDATTFDIIDIAGKTVQSIKKAQNTEGVKISTSGLPTGRYFIRSTGNFMLSTTTFVVF
jgi:Secretion system C-terminal sorting domain/Reeler domain